MKNLKDYLYPEYFNIDTSENVYYKEQEKIYESILHSYSPEKLKEKLEQYFNIDVQFLSNKDYQATIKSLAFIIPASKVEILNNDKYKNLLNQFNYYETSRVRNMRNGHQQYTIIIEPNIPDDCSNLVYETFGGVVYHITRNVLLNNILSAGLRPKSREFRKYDNRIYFTGGKNKSEIKKNINSIISTLGLFTDELCVLKIDLNKNPQKIKIFNDPTQLYGFGLYTKEYIDKNCIEVLQTH